MNRTAYQAARRAYRASCRLSLLQPGALETRMTARAALLAATGHWEDCTPARWAGQRRMIFTANGSAVHSWTVYAACTRWMRAH